jgi:hypothetical protein
MSDYLEWISAVVMGFANAPNDGPEEPLTDEESFFDDWWADLEGHRWEFSK